MGRPGERGHWPSAERLPVYRQPSLLALLPITNLRVSIGSYQVPLAADTQIRYNTYTRARDTNPAVTQIHTHAPTTHLLDVYGDVEEVQNAVHGTRSEDEALRRSG